MGAVCPVGGGGARRPRADSGSDERPIHCPANWLADHARAALRTMPSKAAEIQITVLRVSGPGPYALRS